MGVFWAIIWSMVDHIVPNNESYVDFLSQCFQLFPFPHVVFAMFFQSLKVLLECVLTPFCVRVDLGADLCGWL